jgi:hypothetical protein
MQISDPIAIGGLIISSVVTPLNLDSADRETVVQELKWLFSAAGHFRQIRAGQIALDRPVAVPVPAGVEKTAAEANNQLLLNRVKELVKDWSASAGFKTLEDKVETQLSMWDNELLTLLHGLTSYLNYLNGWLEQETRLGEAGKFDDRLQNNIKGARIKIARTMAEMTELISQLYGLSVATPGQLVELLEE